MGAPEYPEEKRCSDCDDEEKNDKTLYQQGYPISAVCMVRGLK